MAAYLQPLLFFQRFIIPSMLVLLVWFTWRSIFRKDFAVGLGLYLCIVVIVDEFLNTAIYIPGLSTGSLRYSELFALILLCTRPPEIPRLPLHGKVVLFASLYFGLLFLSVFRDDSLLGGLFEFRANVFPHIVAFTIALRGLRTPEDVNRFLMVLMVLAGFVGLFMLWDVVFDRWILQSDMLYKDIYSHNRGRNRFGSIFLNPNYLGAFIVLVFPAALVYLLNETRRWRRLFVAAGLLLLAFSLVQTQSRGAILSFAIALGMLVLGPCGNVSRKRRIGLLAMCGFAFLLMPGFLDHALQRFNGFEADTQAGRSRETTWEYSLRIVGDHPFGGVGFGEAQFMRTMIAYGFEETYGVETLDAPHNSYLQVAVYAGLPALIAFIVLNAMLLLRSLRVSMRAAPSDQKAGAVFGLAVGVVAFLAAIFPDLQLFTANVGSVYWVLVALLSSLLTSATNEDAVERRSTRARPRDFIGHGASLSNRAGTWRRE